MEASYKDKIWLYTKELLPEVGYFELAWILRLNEGQAKKLWDKIAIAIALSGPLYPWCQREMSHPCLVCEKGRTFGACRAFNWDRLKPRARKAYKTALTLDRPVLKAPTAYDFLGRDDDLISLYLGKAGSPGGVIENKP